MHRKRAVDKNVPETVEEFTKRYCELTTVLVSNKCVMGLCYTQLYDIEQEQNDLYFYNRTPKFDEETMTKLKKAM